MTHCDVVVLDYGSGNLRSAVRMLERVGAHVELTADPDRALAAEGLFVPGVGNFHACLRGLRAVDGPRLVAERLAAGRPVMGICVGMQVLFAGSDEPNEDGAEPGLAVWPARVERLAAPVVPHMGWSRVQVPEGSRLFAGVAAEHFYFVHSYAARHWPSPPPGACVSWADHGGPFVAAVEDGPLWATQFHPEKSGDAGARLLENWVRSLQPAREPTTSAERGHDD
ncbi:MAG TPA: imidazole glycerol phosphate synthase subunit HisH [Segeticoccus sp.]|uniref:imidazole glycerol phosphate synthase subunit HisH n=1 Tax=Segeticoccus sp. TaxID=2706531 RepID=UPI002D7EA441|nr:imidazole glycerol phosphate synthase subunit HisH [Segeticoccus sp.]HET8600693.1 imidazole glycerol phosphate synthase subunit HisH [Segeticoccus sp.]